MKIFLIFSIFISLGICEVPRSALEEARNERNRLVAKYLKTLKKEEGAIRLIGGQGEWEGNVEILHNNRWGSICDDEWDESEAKVVCRQLGYPGYKHVTHSSTFGLAKRRYWMDNLFCEGFERELTHCRFERWGSSDCTSAEAAGVVCSRPENKTIPLVKEVEKPKPIPKKPIHKKHRMDIRLKGGRKSTEGRVEVRLNNGNWGTICSDGWSLLEATVICKQLRFGYAAGAYQTDYFGGSNVSEILISGTECQGNETSLADCLHHEYTNGYLHCHGNKNHVASVTCDDFAPDLVFDFNELENTAHIQDVPMMFLQCAMEENCAASEAYNIRRDNHNWHIVTRRLLRFTASVLNAGNIDFRPSIPKHLWEWHMCHMHYHSMEVFAVFDIYDYKGSKVAEGHKASFCLEDNKCQRGVEPKYACANYGDQGISVNCSDIYKHNIDCQWVDISEVDFGEYRMKVSVNPEFKVPEMSFHNNAADCKLTYTPEYAKVYDCYLTRP